MAPKIIHFDDVKSILNYCEPKVKNILPVKELLSYVTGDELLSESSNQEIRANARNDGDANAVYCLFAHIKRKPKAFIALVAALKKINNTCYKEIVSSMKKHFKNKKGELEEVMQTVSEKYDDLFKHSHHSDDDDDDDDDNGHGGAKGPEPPKPQEPSEVVYSRETQPQYQHQQQQHQQQQHQQQQHQQRQLSPSPISNIEPAEPISQLHYHAFSQIAEELDKPHTSGELNWQRLIKCRGVKVSRKEYKRLKESDEPGEKLLDLLGDRDHTLRELGQWFQQMELVQPLARLQEHANEVVKDTTRSPPNTEPQPIPVSPPPPYESDLDRFDENNLNNGIERSRRHVRGPNIVLPSLQQNVPCQILTKSVDKVSNTNTVSEEAMIQPLQPSSSMENLREHHPVVVPTTQHLVPSSRVSDMTSRTTAVEAEDDGTKNTSKVPEQERQDLIYDRVHQHDNNTDNLDSFIDKRPKSHNVPKDFDGKDKVAEVTPEPINTQAVTAGMEAQLPDLCVRRETGQAMIQNQNDEVIVDEEKTNVENIPEDIKITSNSGGSNLPTVVNDSPGSSLASSLGSVDTANRVTEGSNVPTTVDDSLGSSFASGLGSIDTADRVTEGSNVPTVVPSSIDSSVSQPSESHDNLTAPDADNEAEGTVDLMEDITDPELKGTRHIDAVDPGTDSTAKSAEMEMEELKSDRVNQHDKLLENVSPTESGDADQQLEEGSIGTSHEFRSYISEPDMPGGARNDISGQLSATQEEEEKVLLELQHVEGSVIDFNDAVETFQDVRERRENDPDEKET